MSSFLPEKCDQCIQFCERWGTLDRVPSGSILDEPTVFTHNGNLISYVKIKKYDQCEVCKTKLNDCIYIKNGEYFTIFPQNELTVVDCAVKHPLFHNSSQIMPTDLGTFIIPSTRRHDLLFLRGIKVSPNMDGRMMSTVYYSREGIHESSVRNLQQSAFTVFYDINKDVYLIDNSGNVLEYETLQSICNASEDIKIDRWEMMYANDRMRVKIHAFTNRVEILTDGAPVGRHTKPALRDPHE